MADEWATERVVDLPPGSVLEQFNLAGVLVPGDLHVANALGRLGGDSDALVMLAAALAVRAPRVGHVLADLATVSSTVTLEGEGQLPELPWPEPLSWSKRLAESPLVAVGEQAREARPLRLLGTALYLDRYWRDERFVASEVLARCAGEDLEVDEAVLEEGVRRLFGDSTGSLQAEASVRALRRRFSVIVGGPGTGKTTTVARLLVLLDEQAASAGHPGPLVALAAPTGKAAGRMAEAVHEEARRLHMATAARARLLDLGASTVHRLLGRHPSSATRFRHDRGNRLPHDVVVVDETSMMSLPLMARLLEAARPEARLVLLGDQHQLASVEAGAVLADIVGPPRALPLGVPSAERPPIASSITALRDNYRFSGALAELAGGVRDGDVGHVLAVLSRNDLSHGGGESSVAWLRVETREAAETREDRLEPLVSAVLAHGRPLVQAARHGQVDEALMALDGFRLLCAHRDGPWGASTWNLLSERWLDVRSQGAQDTAWYPGRPLIVTENDYGLGLFNGDVGVVVRGEEGRLSAMFRRPGGLVALSPARLGGSETAFALTAHRAQGSEFDEVAVLLPPPGSRILTRELLYTALTRAKRRVLLVGSEESVVCAVKRPVARASGLAARLWG